MNVMLYDMRPIGDHGLDELMEHISKFNDLRNMSIVEIGSYLGQSTTIFAEKFERVISIDPFLDNYDINDPACHIGHFNLVYDGFIRRTLNYKNIMNIKKTSDDAIKLFDYKSVDVVYIDGCHTLDQVDKDIQNYLPIIKDGGFICGHDYHPGWQGVINAIVKNIGEPDAIFSDTSWIKRI